MPAQKLKILVPVFFTFATLITASALNKSKPVPTRDSLQTFVELKKAKEQPKIRKRKPRRQKKLKNIKQAPRVSPNVAITMDIPLEMPEVEDVDAEIYTAAENVVPPAPNSGNPPPSYPQSARADGVQGRVVVMIYVDEYGFVVRSRIVSSTPPGVFDSSVLTAIREWKFSPATLRGKPVDQWVEIPFNFVM